MLQDRLVFVASTSKRRQDTNVSLATTDSIKVLFLPTVEISPEDSYCKSIYELINLSGGLKEELEYTNGYIYRQVYFYFLDYFPVAIAKLDLDRYSNYNSRYTLFSPFYTPFTNSDVGDLEYKIPLPVFWFSDSLTYSIVSKFNYSLIERGHERADKIQKILKPKFNEFYFSNYLGMFNIVYKHV